MSTVPNTKITATFIDKQPGHDTPLFYGNSGGSAPMASLNAGNSQALYLGGAGINLGFENALKGLQNCALYQTRHQALLAAYQKSGTATETYQSEDPTKFSLLDAAKPTTQNAGWYDGICFVDVFGDGLCPHANTNNAAMLYLAPPYGGNYAGIPEFLAAIRAAASNTATALGQYNSAAASAKLPVLEVLRLCLYSSGGYKIAKTDPNDIALNIYYGLHDVLQNDACGLTGLEFPCNNDKHDPLFTAVRDLIGN